MASTPTRDTLLVETSWLAEHLGEPGLAIVDIRGSIRPATAPRPHYAAKREAYLEAHIPGAVFVDWTEDIVEPTAPVHMTLAGPTRFKALMERSGIGDGTEVVVYDDSGGLAPRFWWALNYYGHGRVRLLDGGWTKWVAEKREISAAAPRPGPVVFTPKIQAGWRASMGDVRDAMKNPGIDVVDCRSPEEWRGEMGRGEQKGRIPGSKNMPSAGALEGEFRTWKRSEELRALYTGAGIQPERPVITYCNAGVSASVGLFALKLAGFPAVMNYAGSWYEWESDPINPIARGYRSASEQNG
jgi:thiosulfate/3-mercaptopyruvate sulfurtransferase